MQMTLLQQSEKKHIPLNPKSQKDLTQCLSYGFDTLIIIGFKIFAKLIANTIHSYNPLLIHLEQVEFNPNYKARDNTIKTLLLRGPWQAAEEYGLSLTQLLTQLLNLTPSQ